MHCGQKVDAGLHPTMATGTMISSRQERDHEERDQDKHDDPKHFNPPWRRRRRFAVRVFRRLVHNDGSFTLWR
jgi:hypothetical protein